MKSKAKHEADFYLLKLCFLKPQKDKDGKAQRAKYVLKNQFKLNKQEEHKPSYDLDYWDADPATIPKHLKTNPAHQ